MRDGSPLPFSVIQGGLGIHEVSRPGPDYPGLQESLRQGFSVFIFGKTSRIVGIERRGIVIPCEERPTIREALAINDTRMLSLLTGEVKSDPYPQVEFDDPLDAILAAGKQLIVRTKKTGEVVLTIKSERGKGLPRIPNRMVRVSCFEDALETAVRLESMRIVEDPLLGTF
jgi:hypothetical protein